MTTTTMMMMMTKTMKMILVMVLMMMTAVMMVLMMMTAVMMMMLKNVRILLLRMGRNMKSQYCRTIVQLIACGLYSTTSISFCCPDWHCFHLILSLFFYLFTFLLHTAVFNSSIFKYYLQILWCKLAQRVASLRTTVKATVLTCRVRNPACTTTNRPGSRRYINGLSAPDAHAYGAI